MKPLKFSLVEKIIQIFRNFMIKKLKIYIIWGGLFKRIYMPKYAKTFCFNEFRVRIFLEIPLSIESGSYFEDYLAQLEGYLDYLKVGIKNLKLEVAARSKPLNVSWKKILKATIINYEPYTLISPELGDFTFPSECTLKRANIVPWKNLKYVPFPKEDRNYIRIGHLLHNGKLEKNPALIRVDHFGKNVIVTGQTGAGKSMLIKQISNEFYEKCQLIGILYLNLGKGNQEYFYNVDHVFKYGDPDLLIPYFVDESYFDKHLQETASYLISSLGLREPLDKVLKTVMYRIYQINQQLPTSLKALFNALKNWYEQHQYHEEYQTNIMTAFENRVESLFSDPLLDKSLMLRKDIRIPFWYDRWRIGKKVMIDLSMCNPYVKLILSNAIFQMIRALTPDEESNQLLNLIVIDEAHQILEKSKYTVVNSDIHIAKVQLEEIFSNLMREFRSKGLSFVIISNSLSDLFPCVAKLASLKMLFRMDSETARIFTNLPEDHKYLLLLEPQKALILNGNTGERYAIKTIDFPQLEPTLI